MTPSIPPSCTNLPLLKLPFSPPLAAERRVSLRTEAPVEGSWLRESNAWDVTRRRPLIRLLATFSPHFVRGEGEFLKRQRSEHV
jgi:hypothetical protein